jgi:hypothetical protein
MLAYRGGLFVEVSWVVLVTGTWMHGKLTDVDDVDGKTALSRQFLAQFGKIRCSHGKKGVSSW